jgi:hypothetical protein
LLRGSVFANCDQPEEKIMFKENGVILSILRPFLIKSKTDEGAWELPKSFFDRVHEQQQTGNFVEFIKYLPFVFKYNLNMKIFTNHFRELNYFFENKNSDESKLVESYFKLMQNHGLRHEFYIDLISWRNYIFFCQQKEFAYLFLSKS